MEDSIPVEFRSFGVTSKDFDEKEGVLTKTLGTEFDEKEVFFSLFLDKGKLDQESFEFF